MRCTPADSSDDEEDAGDGGQNEESIIHEDADTDEVSERQRAAEWIRGSP